MAASREIIGGVNQLSATVLTVPQIATQHLLA